MSERNVEIVRAALEAFAEGDMDRALAMTDPALVSTRVDPDGAVYNGHDGFERLMAEWLEDFSDWSYRVDELIDAGERVVARLHQMARDAASGVPVEGDYWIVYTLSAGRITRMDIFSDGEEAFAAAGRGG
jgi:ketosteroid isomerase-like protein